MLSLLLPVLNVSFVMQTITLFARSIYISITLISNFSYVYRYNLVHFILFLFVFHFFILNQLLSFISIYHTQLYSFLLLFISITLSFFYFQIAFFSPVSFFCIYKSPFYSSLFYLLCIFHFFILYSIFFFYLRIFRFPFLQLQEQMTKMNNICRNSGASHIWPLKIY